MKKIFLLILGFCLIANMAFAGSLTPVAKVKKAKPVQATSVAPAKSIKPAAVKPRPPNQPVQSTVVKTFVPVKVAPAIRVSIDLIRTLGVKSPGTPAYWQAEVRNIGLGDIAANTLKIKARQSHMQSPAQPATATFGVIHAMRPGQKRGFQGNWTPIVGCTHLEIIVMDNNNRVLARKMHLVEFPRLTVPAKKLFVPDQPLQQQQEMYMKIAKIKHVNHMGNPVEGRDYTWQARCQKLVSGDLPSNRVSLFFDLSNSETGARVHIGTFSYGRTISGDSFTIQYTFKYREAYDTITLRMYDRVIEKTISEKSVNCAPFTQ